MMKKNELMVGDFVAVCNTPLTVAAIGTEKVGFLDDKGEMFYHYFVNVKGIELTAEMLEKNGFTKSRIVNIEWPNGTNLWTYEDSECVVYVYENGIIWWIEVEMTEYAGIIKLAISDVHELQHALKLFGITKKIEL